MPLPECTPLLGWSAYAGSKAGRELADSLRLEEAARRVKVASVYPNGTVSDLLKKIRDQFGEPYDPDQCLQPEDVATAIVDTLDVTEFSV
jgi:NADP-dependent 3-hydroxy acid dehydrogenase YdfG